MKYIHYKGGEYEFVGIGRDEATLTPVVIYRSCATGELWVRPEAEFFGAVEVGDGRLPNDRPVLSNGTSGDSGTAVVRRFIPAPPTPK